MDDSKYDDQDDQEIKIEETLQNLISESDITSVDKLLLQNKNLDISKILDHNGYSLLHKATLNNQSQILKFLIKHQENYLMQVKHNQQEIKQNIQEWLELRTLNEGFTCIHFATFKGYIPIIELLIDQGADIQVKNFQGLNVLHIAAQGNQVASLAYFNTKDIQIDSTDNKQGTALHWACFLGHEESVNYLCSLKDIKLNQQDLEQLTPLHLATVSGNSRVVRKLLLKGAKINVVDKNGKTPYDIAVENQYNNIENMLKQPSFFAQCYNIKPSFLPVRNQRKQLYSFLLFYALGSAIFIAFNFPFFLDKYAWQIILYMTVTFLVLVFFVISWLKNPGGFASEEKNPQKLITLYRSNDPKNVCPECCVVKIQRSRHCEICKKCIAVYDHHCPWINNCVGTKNHVYFVFFITFIWINLFCVIVFSTLHIYKKYDGIEYFNWFEKYDNDQTFFIVKIVLTAFVIMLSLFFFVPLTLLVWVQLNNFLLNQTTFERFSNKNSRNQPTSSIEDMQELRTINKENEDLLSSNHTQNGKQFQKRNLKNCLLMGCQNQQNQDFFQQEYIRNVQNVKHDSSITISSASEN